MTVVSKYLCICRRNMSCADMASARCIVSCRSFVIKLITESHRRLLTKLSVNPAVRPPEAC